MIKENIPVGLSVKLDTVIGEMEFVRSAIDELLVEARQKNNSLLDSKNVTLNIIRQNFTDFYRGLTFHRHFF